MLRPRSTAARPCLNRVQLLVAGYICGADIPHVSNPRIMLTARSAGLMVSSRTNRALAIAGAGRAAVRTGVDNIGLTNSEVPS